MKTSSLFSKIIALVCFVSLLTGFVAYRSGFFAGVSKPNYTVENDTTKKVKKDTVIRDDQYHMRATSKSGAILIEDIDTIGKALREVLGRKALDSAKPIHQVDPTIMSSSKSIHPIITLEKDSSK